MKQIFNKIYIVVCFFTVLGLSSCEDYLDDVPKGEKVPETLADFEALLRYEYGCHRVDINQASILLNDRYVSASYLAYYPLYKANYLWDESADRIDLNSSDETAYYAGYAAISVFNLVIENALTTTEATESEQYEVWAQAKVLRAMSYFNLVNYYAITYDESTASSTLSVPLITSADVNASYTQVSIQAMYDFILNDLEEALPYIPAEAATILHPDLGTIYAFYARVYLQMNNYTKALEYANLALAQNGDLYDWTAYYEANKEQIENKESFLRTASPMDYDYIENYSYRHGSTYYSSSENSLTADRAAMFEEGDARFMSRWKEYTLASETYYYGTLSGYFNYGGITTVEVYLIKAECLARSNDISGAMTVVNTVRKTRILADYYADLSASTLTEAMDYIITTKRNELILTLIPFCDIRRLNNEGTYTVTLSKEYEGASYQLSSTSHMWTMPFPQGAIDNPGNGSITQNVER